MTSDQSDENMECFLAEELSHIFNKRGTIMIVCSDANDTDALIQKVCCEKELPMCLFHTDFEKYGGKARRIRNYQIFEFAKIFDHVTIVSIGEKINSDYHYLTDLLANNKIAFSEQKLEMLDRCDVSEDIVEFWEDLW